VIQAVLFTSMHESMVALPVVFTIGLAAAWLVQRTGGLLAAILLHGMHNGLVFGTLAMATSRMNGG
jgi:membrane protease YdiL (CAAX protease family)